MKETVNREVSWEMSASSRKMRLVSAVVLAAVAAWPCGGGSGLNTLPDASQEGLLSQFSGYASVTVFHYTVPPEVTRATWEFASFQVMMKSIIEINSINGFNRLIDL